MSKDELCLRCAYVDGPRPAGVSGYCSSLCETNAKYIDGLRNDREKRGRSLESLVYHLQRLRNTTDDAYIQDAYDEAITRILGVEGFHLRRGENQVEALVSELEQ